eukprot:scaffold24035_cov67-Isochrysis_galbana.AAC.1
MGRAHLLTPRGPHRPLRNRRRLGAAPVRARNSPALAAARGARAICGAAAGGAARGGLFAAAGV